MRVRAFASLIPVAALLAVCAVTARAPGKTLFAVLGSSTQTYGRYCNSDHNFPLAQGIGVTANMGLVCEAHDGVGSTAAANCGTNAVYHGARIFASDTGTQECTGNVVAWTEASGCSKTLSIKSSSSGACFTSTLTAASWGAN